MILSQIITETILGAMTGYITNDVAIRSLFKKGGVIEKTREEFIEEISALLEKEILTGEVLQEQLELPAVKEAMQQLLNSFFQENLPQCLEQYRLKDIAGKDLLFNRIHEDLYQLWQQQKEQMAAICTASFDLECILTAKQRDSIEKTFLHVLSEQLREGGYIEQFLQQWMEQNGDKTWQEIGLKEWICGLTGELGKLSAPWGAELSAQYEQQITEQLQKLFQQLDFQGLFDSLWEEYRQMPVGQLLYCDETQLLALLRDIVSSEKGKEIFAHAAACLLEALSSVRVPLKELLPNGTIVALKPFLEAQLPVFIERLLAWLEENQIILTQLVDEAVEEVFGDYDGLKGLTLQLVKESMLHNIVQEYGLLIKLEELLQDKKNIAQIADLAVAQINDFFAAQNIGDVIGGMHFKQQKLQKVVQVLLEENLIFYLDKRGAEHLHQFLQRPIESLLPEHWQEAALEKLALLLPSYFLKQLAHFDSSRQFHHLGQQLLKQKINVSISEGFAKKGQKQAEQFLRTEAHFIESWWRQWDLEDLTKGIMMQADNWLLDQFPKWLKRQEEISLQTIYGSVFSDSWQRELVTGAISFLQKKMVAVTNGQLSAMAQQQLKQLSNEDMLQMVKEFMGKELKPLNYLGALLGSMVGLTTGALFSGGLLPAGFTGGQAAAAVIGGKSFLFGAVGYGTNCAAIKGLFWPYKPVAGIPFLQGVIPKQQRSFATSMGRMVEQYVLNEEILQDLLIGNQENWVAKSVILSQKPVVLQEVLHQAVQYKEKLVQGGQASLERFIKEGLLPLLLPFGEKPLAGLYPASVWTGDGVVLEHGIQILKNKLTDLKNAPQPLSDYLTAETVSRWIASAGAKADFPDIKGGWHRFQAQKKPLSVLISEQQQNDWLGTLQRYLLQKLTGASTAKTICDAIERFLAEENLGTALGGQLGSWLEHNMHSLLDSIFEMLLEALADKETVLVKKVQQSIKKRLNYLEKMGYVMMDGDDLVAEVVQRIVQKKLPLFLGLKQQEIADVMMQYWHEQLSGISLRQLQLTLSPAAVQGVTGKIFALPLIQKGTRELLLEAMEQVLQQPIHRYLQLDNVLDAGWWWLQSRWKHCRKEWIEDSVGCFTPFLHEKLQTITTEKLLSSISLDAVQRLPLYDFLHAGGGEVLWRKWYQAIVQNGGEIPLGQWLDWPLAMGQVQQQCEALFRNEAFLQWWHPLLVQEIERLATELEAILPKAARDQLVRIVVQSFLNSIYDYGAQLLQAMDLGNLTKERIMEMKPQQLEEMVWKFGRGYLVHIQNMGWLGAAFAIPGIFLTFFS